jgi:hypothetical protein
LVLAAPTRCHSVGSGRERELRFRDGACVVVPRFKEGPAERGDVARDPR